MKDPVEAEELGQEVMIQSWRKLGDLKDVRVYVSWLRTMICRMAINALTRGHSEVSFPRDDESEWQAPDEEDEDAEMQQELGERKELLMLCMGCLKELDRTVLEAFYLRMLSVQEISDELEVPEGTIKRRLYDARIRLMHVIAGSGFVPELM